jgi:hypothetical protein
MVYSGQKTSNINGVDRTPLPPEDILIAFDTAHVDRRDSWPGARRVPDDMCRAITTSGFIPGMAYSGWV